MPDQSSPTRTVAGRALSELHTGRRDRGRLSSSRIAAFTERLAHDLRTPLTVIQEYAALMREGLVGDLNDEQRRVLDVIADRACDLNRVVDNAMDASRLAEKSHRIWGRPCGLRGIIARIRPQLERKAAVLCVDLRFETVAEGPDIHCDDEAVARAISNIVTAALNLSRDGCRMSISEELHPGLKEAGIRITVGHAGVEPIARLFRDLASVKHTKRENRASQLCEASLAAELIDRNLGRLAVKPLAAGATTLWIGLPIADPVEILHRHVARFTERRAGPQSVSFVGASVCEPVDKELSRDVCSLLNSCIGRGDLAVELDRTRWLMAVVHRQARTEVFQRRIERRRAAVNKKRLGRPLPQVSLRQLGTWNLPNDLTRILAMAVSRIEQCAPADACAE
jgi:His Kinase A (phospho-acceptor) domain